MNTAAQRIFVVFFWLLVIATVGWDGFWILAIFLGPGSETLGFLLVAVLGLLPFIAVTLIRRIATGHWRFGPRW